MDTLCVFKEVHLEYFDQYAGILPREHSVKL